MSKEHLLKTLLTIPDKTIKQADHKAMINVQRELLYARMEELREEFLLVGVGLSNLGEHLLGMFAVLKALVEHMLRILGTSGVNATKVRTSGQAEDREEGSSSKRPKLEEHTEDLPGEPTALYEAQDTTQRLPQLVVATINSMNL